MIKHYEAQLRLRRVKEFGKEITSVLSFYVTERNWVMVEVCHLKSCTLSGERNGHWQELDCALKLYMLTNFTDWIDLA
jgi:hypothetical protein